MTGQQSGWRGNKMGKFSSVLRVLWLTEAVTYLQRTNHSLLSFNAITRCAVILTAKSCWSYFTFFLREPTDRAAQSWHDCGISLQPLVASPTDEENRCLYTRLSEISPYLWECSHSSQITLNSAIWTVWQYRVSLPLLLIPASSCVSLRTKGNSCRQSKTCFLWSWNICSSWVPSAKDGIEI